MRITASLLLVALAVTCAAPVPGTEQAATPPAAEQPVSISVVVYGQVQQPNKFSFPAGTRLRDAIYRAGGFSEWAAKRRVRVQHRDGSRNDYNLERAGHRDYGGDTVLRDGDMVIVPVRLM